MIKKFASINSRRLWRSLSTGGAPGSVLDGSVPQTPEFLENKKAMKLLTTQLAGLIAKIHECGGAKALLRQKERGKLPVRERIDRLLDPGSPFLEIGIFGEYQTMPDDMWVPSAGIVTGIGVVNG
jgi:3-methylcrotonyl-CoA carboxylase beta subunit